MRELVRRGVAAIPALLDHLSDARPTKLSLKGNIADWPDNIAYVGKEYAPRQLDPDKVSPGSYRVGESDPSHDGERFKIYRFK